MVPYSRIRPVLAIIGPTGTGKSQLAIHLAERFGGEVINTDALQLYHGLPIATNKPTPDERRRIPHHLLSLIDLSEPTWNVGKFIKEAESVIAGVHSRGKIPILVGGTHYYTHSLLFENSPSLQGNSMASGGDPSAWPILQRNSYEMLEQLRQLDPVAASWWHPNERRKIQRSLEICLATGEKVSEIYEKQRLARKENPSNHVRIEALCLYLHAERDKLNAHLDDRVDRMIENGLLREVKHMRQKLSDFARDGRAIDLKSGIWIAIGYKEFEGLIDAEEMEKEPSVIEELKRLACERMKIATRQYATRQARYVRNKLLPLYGPQFDRLRVLDASERSTWDIAVANPAREIVEAYLSCETLPSAESSKIQKEDLSSTPHVVQTERCNSCGIITTTVEAWNAHIRSKRHRRMVRASY